MKTPLVEPNFKKLRKEAFEEYSADYPYLVDLGVSSPVVYGKREIIRSWFKSKGIKSFSQYGEGGDVLWDQKWRKFYFKNTTDALLFKLSWM